VLVIFLLKVVSVNNAIFRQLSSIKVKLFLWFWLVTICAIAATRFVSVQLNQDSVKMPIELNSQKKIAQFIKSIEATQVNELPHFIHNIPRHSRLNSIARHIIIKPQNDNERLIAKRRLPRDIASFIHSNEFEKPYTWLLPHAEISGPLELNKNNEVFQVFYVRKGQRPKNFVIMFKQLPNWARIGTPLIVSFIFCWLLARSLSRPLSNISKVAKKLGHGDLSVRLGSDAKRSDELGNVARSFNNMADKLELNMTAHQRLLGDVSHELRSPLTRLQLALALARKNPNDIRLLCEYFDRCELEVSRLDEMIEKVLTLSRLENSSQHIIKNTCSLGALLTSLVEDGNFLAQEKQISIKYHQTNDVELEIDQSLIASAVSNIIINAIKYSPEKSMITVTLSTFTDHIEISVNDEGGGVPPEALSKLFDAFYRVADARDRASGGTGLGLAIAKQAILAHNGSIYAENIQNKGLNVTILLPKSS